MLKKGKSGDRTHIGLRQHCGAALHENLCSTQRSNLIGDVRVANSRLRCLYILELIFTVGNGIREPVLSRTELSSLI